MVAVHDENNLWDMLNTIYPVLRADIVSQILYIMETTHLVFTPNEMLVIYNLPEGTQHLSCTNYDN